MTLAELKAKATELNVAYPDRVTKDHLQKLIRDMTAPPGHEVVSFGRYKNVLFQEVPDQPSLEHPGVRGESQLERRAAADGQLCPAEV